MSLFYKLNDGNAVEILASDNVIYNGTELTKIIHNAKTVWQKVPSKWIMKIKLTMTASGSASGHGESWKYEADDKIHEDINSTVNGSGSYKCTVEATMPNVSLPAGSTAVNPGATMTDVSLNVTEDQITIKGSGSGSGSGEGHGHTTDSPTYGCESRTNFALASKTATLPMEGFNVVLTTSGSGSASYGAPGGHGSSGSVPINLSVNGATTITMKNYGLWTKASVTGGTIKVNNVTCTTDTVFCSTEPKLTDELKLQISGSTSGSGNPCSLNKVVEVAVTLMTSKV